MNLVSYEFVACQDAKRGVLILSEVITRNLHAFLCFIFIQRLISTNLMNISSVFIAVMLHGLDPMHEKFI